MHKVKITKRQRKLVKHLTQSTSSMVNLCLEHGSRITIKGGVYIGSVPEFTVKYAGAGAKFLPVEYVKIAKGVPFIRVF